MCAHCWVQTISYPMRSISSIAEDMIKIWFEQVLALMHPSCILFLYRNFFCGRNYTCYSHSGRKFE